MHKTQRYIFAGLMLVAPLVVSAAPSTFTDIFKAIALILYRLIQLSYPLATLLFAWGIIQYFLSGGDERKLALGKKYIIYGIVALVVITVVWGIVNLIASIFDFITPIPGIKTVNLLG